MTKVLIIEDDKLLREAYAEILNSEGFTTDCAADGNEGLKRLASFQPDLILLDILMPHSDGLDFMRRAEIRARHPQTKVLIFSNLSSVGKIDEILALGADRHVLKSSLSPKELVFTIKEVLGDSA
jgi:two-component system response regulator MprA